jgi:hypothetical protein
MTPSRLEYWRASKALEKYAGIFAKELRIAIYWAKWQLWTLLPLSQFSYNNIKKEYSITFKKAMMTNEMYILGDQLLGTVPPLTIRLVADPHERREIQPDGRCIFKINSVEMYSGNKLLEDETDMDIVFRLMYYSRWPVEEEFETNGNELVAISFNARPEELAKEQEFQMLGSFSEIMSREFENATAPQGLIEYLGMMGKGNVYTPHIPDDYVSKGFRLWRFTITPNEVPPND